MKNLTGLKQFMAVCETRNLTAAAQTLGVSQPALTQAIARLERQLDVILFDRSTRPLDLTAYGVALLEYARGLEHSTDALTAKLDAMKTGSGGMLRVGSGPDWIHQVLPVAISGLLADNPLVRVNLTVALNDELRRRLDAAEIDLFFSSVTDAHFGAAYSTRILLREKMHVVARSDHPIHGAGPQALEAMTHLPWVLAGDDTFGRQLLRRIFRQSGLELPQPAVETNSIRAMINILRHSQMLGFLSRSHAQAYGEIDIVETDVDMPQREGAAVWRSDTRLLPVAENLLTRAAAVIDARND